MQRKYEGAMCNIFGGGTYPGRKRRTQTQTLPVQQKNKTTMEKSQVVNVRVESVMKCPKCSAPSVKNGLLHPRKQPDNPPPRRFKR